MNPEGQSYANPGPPWGYQVIAFLEKALPGWFFNRLLDAGTFIGLLVMHDRRRHSAAYLETLLGRKPRLREQFRHFRAFVTGLVLKLQAGRHRYPEMRFSPTANREAFLELCESGEQVLFGTFHVGYSDLMGCMLKEFHQRISMVRLKVGNSRDTEVMQTAFPDSVHFIWINNPREFIFRLKEAIDSGDSIGLQCDRTQFASKIEGFQFLGRRRKFPFTIYHLADLFGLPVVFSFTGPVGASGIIEVTTSPVFHPGPDRKENLRRGRQHFQRVLAELEGHLHRHPELWFNFLPLNPALHDQVD